MITGPVDKKTSVWKLSHREHTSDTTSRKPQSSSDQIVISNSSLYINFTSFIDLVSSPCGVRCERTCEVLLQQVLETEEHHLIELGAFLTSAFKVGVDFADVGRILFVVCDLKEKHTHTQRSNTHLLGVTVIYL